MIRLRRPSVTLPCLCGPREAGKTTEEHRQLHDGDPSAELIFDECWSNEQVHGALHAMQGWVCVYCLRKTDARDVHHVDHFRPKLGGYFWLAYEFTNYFWSCTFCSLRKGSRFPLCDESERTAFDTRNDIGGEGRLLIDPVPDPVDEWLQVEMEKDSEIGDIKPQTDDPTTIAWKRVDQTIRFFGLNAHNEEHKSDRARVIEELTKLHQRGDLEELSRRASRFHEHSLTARWFLKVFQPDGLPDLQVEVRWFVEDLCKRLREMHDTRKITGDESSSAARRRRIIQWTLAVLWKDPPTGSSAEVEMWLDDAGCKKYVQKFYQQLCNAESEQQQA